jgi:hypothetical protein
VNIVFVHPHAKTYSLTLPAKTDMTPFAASELPEQSPKYVAFVGVNVKLVSLFVVRRTMKFADEAPATMFVVSANVGRSDSCHDFAKPFLVGVGIMFTGYLFNYILG